MNKLPYWRLSGFYFFYFAALGAFIPYWSLHLQDKGLSPSEIGQLMALFQASKIVSPNLWGWLADRFDRSVLLVRIACVLTAASFALFFGASGFAQMAWITFVMGFFWNAPMPIFEAVTLSFLQNNAHFYSRVRLWGSLGFIAAVLAVGFSLDRYMGITAQPILVFVLFLGLGFSSFLVPERSVRSHENGSLAAILKQPQVLAFFLAIILIQVSHGPYYAFYSVYLSDNGFSHGAIGQLWALGVISEIGILIFLPKLLKVCRLRTLLLISIVLGILRWLIIAWFVTDEVMVVLAQILHAATFGITHVTAIHLIHQYFKGSHHGKGQALYSSLSFGLGGMLGSYYSGEFWVLWGPGMVFSIAALSSFVAFILVAVWVERKPFKI